MSLCSQDNPIPPQAVSFKSPLSKQTCDGQKPLGQECFHSNDQQIMTLVRTDRTCEVKLIRGVNLLSEPALHADHLGVNIGSPIHLSS